jgi:tetratricopeptide (TPR) repeat protein
LSRRTVLLLGLLAAAAALFAWQHTHRLDADRAAASANVPAAEERGRGFHDARIDDVAGILTPFGPRLSRMTDDLLKDAGVEVHVVTTVESGLIEVQSERLFREREVGRDAPTGGILVLLNPATEQARIEVAYSLEPGLTDLHMSRIARDQLAPYASYAIAGMAVMDVLHYLRDQVYVAAVTGDITLGEEFRRRAAFMPYRRFLSGGAGAKTKLPDVPMDADLKKPVPAERRARYAPSADVRQSVDSFLRASADFAGDPTLPLFTEGSRLLRTHYPFAPFEETTRRERIEASKPLLFRVQGDYAVATSERPAHGFVPVLLHREAGLWRVDLVETWKNIFFDSNGNYFLRNSNTPYAFGLAELGDGRWHGIEAIPLGDRDLAAERERLEGATDVLGLLRRGDLWFRNAFVFAPSFAAFEAAARESPKDPLVLQTLADRAQYLGFPELAIPAYEVAGPGLELSLAEAWNDQGDARRAGEWVDRALAEDPYDLYALNWKQYLAQQHGTKGEQQAAGAAVLRVYSDRRQPGNPVWLRFSPQRPEFHPESTVLSGGVTVFDHSRFGVTMTNTSARPVIVDSVQLTSRGTAAASGLGDVKDYWPWPAGERRLGPGESLHFDKLWGFTVDSGHEHVRYVFRTCWHGAGESVRQCRRQWVDVLP